MLKNRSAGEAMPGGEDRPRKKLSFRDPEVMVPVRSGPLSAPTKSAAQPQLNRPHSVTGVVGLGGFSALGGVPGMSTPSSSSSSGGPFFKGITSSPGIPSPSLSPKGVAPHLANHSSTRSNSTKLESKPLLIYEEARLQQRSGPAKKENRSPIREETSAASSPVTKKHQPQQPGKPSSARKVDGTAPNRGNQAKKTSPSIAPQSARQSTCKQQEDAPASLTTSSTDKDRKPQLACPSLEDLELENQAMRVVRTVGQAFEVVHKMTQKDKSPSPEPPLEDDISREGSEDSSDKPKKDGLDSESGQEDLMTLTSDTYNEDALDPLPSRPSKLEPLAPPVGSDITKKAVGETFSSPLSEPLPAGDHLPQAGTPLSVHHELQLLREQLEQQQQQTQAAVAQVHLLRDQLAAETAARLEAQARTHQLLVHNKELLEHIQQLVLQVRDLEVKMHGSGGGGGASPTTIQMLPNLPEMKPEQRPSARPLPPQMHHQLLPQETGSSASLCSDTDPKRDPGSAHSSGESVTAAIAQLYNMDLSGRLPQVPEDSVPLTPFGAVPLGTQRVPLNGPITRAASERYSRQETLAQLQRMAWARHTTK